MFLYRFILLYIYNCEPSLPNPTIKQVIPTRNYIKTDTAQSELGFLNSLWGARNRVGIGLSYRPARLHRLAEFIPWNRFLGSINV
jgi:hypothetical protein